ncbi:MAG: hypothetical protein ACLP5V_13865 [Candidatus Bathyarchaeia archaeon]
MARRRRKTRKRRTSKTKRKLKKSIRAARWNLGRRLKKLGRKLT